jgi:hypothetical protein
MATNSKAYEKERYEWYKSHGICVRCLKESAKSGHVVCWRCLANENDYARIYYHKNGRSDEQKEKDKESRERYIEKRNQEGLCWRCGLRPPIGKGKYSQCRVCANKAAEQKRERSRAKGTIPQELRGNGKYCYHCCKPNCKGEKLCSNCLERAKLQAETAREKIDYSNHIWKTKYPLF